MVQNEIFMRGKSKLGGAGGVLKMHSSPCKLESLTTPLSPVKTTGPVGSIGSALDSHDSNVQSCMCVSWVRSSE